MGARRASEGCPSLALRAPIDALESSVTAALAGDTCDAAFSSWAAGALAGGGGSTLSAIGTAACGAAGRLNRLYSLYPPQISKRHGNTALALQRWQFSARKSGS
jgi:hypothetical protein